MRWADWSADWRTAGWCLRIPPRVSFSRHRASCPDCKSRKRTFWPRSDKLKLIQSNIASVQAKLNAAKAEQQAKEQAEKEEKAACTCPSCGHENPEGVKFCQECGTKLGGSAKKHCTSCGAELTPGTRFCGECGARQPE